uniref:Acetyl-coenzyme A carboxylase carboxyl transferase subunit beta, chloroplastic n=1 Tax=Hemilophia sessilifolia TaxID=1862636 RepID=A0A6M8YXZ2_9BRAS|nr:carboxytransferase beta subunit [Hemilophia sessilifolia]QKK43857.1 carboxytransferase beta subunit [Hemilophia sessilifolia]
MEKLWFNLMFSKGELKYGGELSKAMDSFAPSEKTTISQDRFIYDMDKNFYGWGERSSYSNNIDLLVSSKDIRNFISDDTFFVRDSNKNRFSIYFDIKKNFVEVKNNFNDREFFFYSYCSSNYLNNRSKGDNDLHYDPYIKDTKYNCTNHSNSCIDSYFRSYICIDSNFLSVLSDSNNFNESYIYNFICSESGKIRESKNYKIRTNRNHSNLISSKDFDITQNYNQLWIQCDNCYGLMYKKVKMNVCEQCGHYLKMSSSERIELSVDPGTWNPMDEDMASADPIKFHSKEEPYKNRIDSAQKTTGLTDAVQTGTGQLNGIPVALGVMDFQFMGGSMGSVVGEKITRLIEYATNQCLPLILVCSSGGARMQEGSLSLMQMAKISSVLCDYQLSKKLFYISILTSPTTGGVTASFGMLGDIIIAEPYAYIAFAGKRVIEQTLKKAMPEGSQAAESLLRKGLLDAIVPRNLLKGVLSELFQLHAFFPLNKN